MQAVENFDYVRSVEKQVAHAALECALTLQSASQQAAFAKYRVLIRHSIAELPFNPPKVSVD